MPRLMLASICLVAAAAVPACHKDSPTGNNANAQLTVVENAFVGLWSRYRSSNARTEYILIKPGRSACYFEIGNANWTKLVYKDWPSWTINESSPVGTAMYIVTIPASGLSSGYTFDYGHMQVFPTGLDNVIYTPDHGTNAALACSP